jgi:hypothetical protein
MKYMLLIYNDEQDWARREEVEQQRIMKEAAQLLERVAPMGKRLANAPLHPTSTATSVRVIDGEQLVTDGPFAETHEQLAGFVLIDADNLNEAIGIAGQLAAAKWGTIEIRPVIDLPESFGSEQ